MPPHPAHAAHRREEEQWTTRRLMAWMTQAFEAKGLDSPRLMSEMLIAHVLGCERLRLYMDADRPASPLERATLRDLVGRALNHEPVQYLVGEAWFFSLPFKVDRRVLVPRPATETIVEHVLQHARAEPGFGGKTGEGLVIADVCTGSGCIAIALLKNLPAARGVGTDISSDALDVAKVNAGRHGVTDRLDLVAGDLLGPLAEHPATRAEGSVGFLVSNPPYIPDHEWNGGKVGLNVKGQEPERALRGGVDGLDYVRRLVADGPRFLRPGGLLLVEVADSTAAGALDLLTARPEMESARVLADFEGLPRVIVAHRRR